MEYKDENPFEALREEGEEKHDQSDDTQNKMQTKEWVNQVFGKGIVADKVKENQNTKGDKDDASTVGAEAKLQHHKKDYSEDQQPTDDIEKKGERKKKEETKIPGKEQEDVINDANDKAIVMFEEQMNDALPLAISMDDNIDKEDLRGTIENVAVSADLSPKQKDKLKEQLSKHKKIRVWRYDGTS